MTRTSAVAAAVAVVLALAGCGVSSPAPTPTVTVTVTPAAEEVAAPPAPAATDAPSVSHDPAASPSPDGSEASPSTPPSASSLAGTATAFHDAPGQADEAVRNAEAQGRTDDAALLRRIADQPTAAWIGGWTGDVTGTVATLTGAAADAGEVALLVLYNIPGRDCGLHSAGGAALDEYLAWIDRVVAGIDPDAVTWVILEPDALAQLGDCDGQGDRAGLLAGAAERLDDAGVKVFLDAGHSNWRAVEDTVERIRRVGADHLSGFATNTSNYNALADERAWGDAVGAAVGLPYVTDTSRNGNGSTGEWCNPRGRALGVAPALDEAALAAGAGMVATVWAKVPGESDGACNGGPAAGQWWDEVALELAQNSG